MNAFYVKEIDALEWVTRRASKNTASDARIELQAEKPIDWEPLAGVDLAHERHSLVTSLAARPICRQVGRQATETIKPAVAAGVFHDV